MGTLKNLDIEKTDLKRTLKMLESLSRDHRIDISARIDAYYRDEMLRESGEPKALEEQEEKRELQLV